MYFYLIFNFFCCESNYSVETSCRCNARTEERGTPSLPQFLCNIFCDSRGVFVLSVLIISGFLINSVSGEPSSPAPTLLIGN